MKICLVTHTIPRFAGDPSAPFIHTLGESLVSSENEICVLSPYNKKIDKKFARKYKLETYKYVFPDFLHILGYSGTLKGDRSMSLIGYLLSPLLYFFGFIALLRVVRKYGVEIISAHWIIPNGFIAAIVSRISGIPFTVTIPGSDIYMGGKNFFFRWMVGFAAKNASWVISDSPHYIKQLNELGFNPPKVGIIRYGVDTKKFKPDFDKKPKTPTILAIGRMVPKKGFIYLVKALPKIVKRVKGVKLIMIGDGEERESLEKLADSLGVSKSIEFPGMVPHTKLVEFYQSSDVFVMPSIKDDKGNIDASPVSMMEAMACGLPVVTTRFGGSNDLIKDGVTGYLVAERSSSKIARAVIKLLLAKAQNKLVRKIAVENFSSESVASRYTGIFRDILQRNEK